LLSCSLIACTSAWSWSKCGSSSDFYDVKTVTMKPDPPVAGKNITFTLSGELKEVVTGGTSTTNTYWEGIWVKTITDQICGPSPPHPKCPIPAGTWTVGESNLIPSFSPSGSYENDVKIVDQNNKELSCLVIKFTI